MPSLVTQLANRISELSAAFFDGTVQSNPWFPAIAASTLLVVAALAATMLLARRRAVESESRYRAAFDQTTFGMALLTPQGVVLLANDKLAQMLRRSPESLVDLHFEKLLRDAQQTGDISNAWAPSEEASDRRLIRADGSSMWARLSFCRVRKGKVLIIAEDISEGRELRDTLARFSTIDKLTGLINRAEIESRLEAVLASTQQTAARHTFCHIDIDEFRLINDTWGRAAGDKVLRMVATTLANELAPPGWVGRLGDDEFAVMFEFEPLEIGASAASELNRTIADMALIWEGRRFPLTVSIGLVEVTGDTPSVAWLTRAAETACHVAKVSGRNRVRTYVETDEEVVRWRNDTEWASEIRTAVGDGRLLLYAQRIVPLQQNNDERGLQYEVLLRIVDDAGEIQSPGPLLSAAEHFSMASIVDRKVLTMAVDVLARNPAHLASLERCHINVSGQSATSTEFRIFVEALLDAHPNVAPKLCFELTETEAMERAQANEFIAVVHRKGCSVALDDFGNGLSSFAYLKSLAADIVKIDGTFVRGIATETLDRAVVRSITEVCRYIGKEVVAEGVESPEVAEHLKAIGVDGMQGFAIHRPCPLEDLVRERVGVPG